MIKTFTRCNSFVAMFVAALMFVAASPVITMAQQSVDPSGACTPSSNGVFINGQTGTFYCVPNTPGAAAGTWSSVGQGVRGVYAAHAVWSFATDGGAISTITPAINQVIPINAIVYGAIVNSTTALVGASGTIAVGTSAGSSTTSIKAATAVASYTTNAVLAGAPIFTAGSAFKMTAAGSITITIATTPMSAGVLDITVLYIIPNA